MIKQYRIRDFDFKLVILVIALTLIGIFAVGSADESLQKTQIAGFIFGLFLMVVISFFDYSVLIKLNWLFYIANIVLLLLVRTSLGGGQPSLSGAGRGYRMDHQCGDGHLPPESGRDTERGSGIFKHSYDWAG